MHRFLLFSAAVLTAAASVVQASPASAPVSLNPTHPAIHAGTHTAPPTAGSAFKVTRAPQLPASRAGEEAYTVTVSYPNLGDLDVIGLAYADEHADYWELAGDYEEFTVGRSGSYTVAAIFQEPEDGKPMRVVVMENLAINADKAITIDPTTATNLVSFKPVDIDGTEISGPLVNQDWDVIGEGTISSDMPHAICSSLASRRLGLLVNYETDFIRIERDGKTIVNARGGDFLITPGLSDDFACTQTACAFTRDNLEPMLISMISDGTRAQTVVNDKDNFVNNTVEELYTTDNVIIDAEIEEKLVFYGWFDCWKGIPEVVTNVELDADNIQGKRLHYCLAETPRGAEAFHDIIPCLYPVWKEAPEEFPDAIWVETHWMYPPLLKPEDGDMHAIVTPLIDTYYQNALFITPEGISTDLTLWGEPDFSFALNNSRQVAFDNAPYVQLIDRSTTARNGVLWLHTGRVGEDCYWMSKTDAIHFEFDGKELNGVYNEIYDQYIQFWDEISSTLNQYKGKIVLRITSPRSLTVDGIMAEASTEAVWDRSQTGDINVPNLTMLQFRDKQGVVTDRFENAAEGVITFTAADLTHEFDLVYDADGNPVGTREYYAFASTPEVTVEYAPLHTDLWHPLAVEEIKSKFFMPGYGSFFQGNLDGINEGTPYGWFDLRITLRDAAGNSLTSTVSPAFKINSLASVETVAGPVEAPAVTATYSLQGFKVDNPQPGGVYIQTMSDGSCAKIIR